MPAIYPAQVTVSVTGIDENPVDGSTTTAICSNWAHDHADEVIHSGIITSATPTLIFKDSSCTDADNNATILIAATDTGTGSEDIDVTFAQQIAGAETNFLVSDADGSITLGDTSRGIVLSGTVTSGDFTISDATPVLQLKDSSCTDADVNFDITASATDTGTGAEDIDVVFAAQVAGNKVTFINFDADGLLALGYNGQTTFASKLTYGNPVTAVTATASPANTDSGTVYTNEGDSDGATITLPAAQTSPSLIFTAIVQVAQILTITAGSGDTIRISSNVTAAAGSITSNVVGSSITLVCINATEWIATSVVGSWSI